MARMRGDYDRETSADDKRLIGHILKTPNNRDSVRLIRKAGWIFRILGVKSYAFGRLPAFMAENRKTGRRFYASTPAEILHSIRTHKAEY